MLTTTSNHKVDVFVLGPLTKHPNADALSLIRIGDTDYSYVGRTEDWEGKVGSLVAWIPPDSLVDLKRPEFSFLDKERVKAKKLRGIISYGLLVAAPVGVGVGDDAADVLGVKHYAPVIRNTNTNKPQFGSTDALAGPDKPGYDIENYLKYARKVFVAGEQVIVTEKIHGACARYLWDGTTFWCGSRNEWKSEYSLPSKLTLEEVTDRIRGDKELTQEITDKAKFVFDKITKPGSARNMWWRALPDAVKAYCTNNPGHTVYGEIYGNVQDLKYGAGSEVWFKAFDILKPDGTWVDSEVLHDPDSFYSFDRVPVIYQGPFDWDNVMGLCSGKSTLAEHIREGVVVKPVQERWSEIIGRVSLKLINPAYLEK